MTTKAVGTPRKISEETRLTKNSRISESMKVTRERRRNQVCKTIDLKIQANKLSATQREALIRLFLEAKWIRNDALAHGIDDYKLGSTVQVKVGDKIETRELTAIGSQMKQSVITQLKNDRKTLAARKKKGYKVGSLKFAREVNSVDLKQYGSTHKFVSKNKMKLQNVPKHVRVSGTSQIPDGAEFANAKLVRRADGYHVILTVFIDKDSISNHDEFESGTVIGIDMGVHDAFVFSDGSKANAVVEESDRLRRLQKKLSRQQKGSNNYRRTQVLIRREYQKLDNKRDDAARKLVHDLLLNEIVFMQDENISEWRKKGSHARGSRKIQHGILGRVKSRLSKHDRVVVLDRFEPTTRSCECGFIFEEGLDLSKRKFMCPSCGIHMDRDIHAACMMIFLGLGRVDSSSPVGRRLARVELTSGLVRSKDLSSFVAKQWAMKHETPLL